MLRILKKTTLAILVLLVVIIIGSFISYSTYSAKDPEVEVETATLAYYNDTYEECREAFAKSTANIAADFDSVKTGKIFVPSQTDSDLSIDWCYVPAQSSNKDKLLIINSGLHGIEGYTGSAIQLMFIDKILKQQLAENTGVLFLHGINPYGFKYHRKVTENNIDLNRNCVPESQNFDIENKGFEELENFVMPAHPVSLQSLENQFFYVVSIFKIIKESMQVLKQAALQGQYDFEKGFYYGGKDYEPQIKLLKPLLIDIIEQYNTTLTLDLHTGYGERGTLHLFIDKPEDKEVLNGIEKIFGKDNIDWGDSGDFYTITGEFTVWVNNLVPDKLCIPMLFEFGTLNSQKTFGSIKSMQIMILENQGAHWGYKNDNNERKVKTLFDEMYYPSSPVWRSKVIVDAQKMMNEMMANYQEIQF